MYNQKSKKGAIELSMNVIVIIVIGVTLLILGLAFVGKIFKQGDTILDNIPALPVGDDGNLKTGLNLQQSQTDLKMGASRDVILKVANLDNKDSSKVTLAINPVISKNIESGDIQCYFLENGENTLDLGAIKSGNLKKVTIQVKTLDNVKLGNKACTIEANGVGEGTQKESLSIMVTK